ncbi:Acyl-coenzyme A synthetase/AMP-(fatty) acid ligase [Minicystis rosea]|nr:Acyl-coenzyme A synthetase/AMP-(fatty) acid ligase [Minicystis rosea]
MAEDRERIVRWRHWGPYLSERAWGTVREDYSANGDAWNHFPHDHARSRTYRWSEDGIAGICDRSQILCLALALWNEKDEILKERLFGLSGHEGNHGEDVKEVYYYEDATPTSSYLRYLYKYPQRRYPYAELVAHGRSRGADQREVELADLGMFDEDRYFDVTVEYAKRGPSDILMAVTIENRGPDEAPIHVLPHLWFRNTWSWSEPPDHPPSIREIAWRPAGDEPVRFKAARARHPALGEMMLYLEEEASLLFTNNETNTQALWGSPARTPYVKDAFHHHVVHGDTSRVSPDGVGSKMAAWRRFVVPAGGRVRLLARLSSQVESDPFAGSDALLAQRREEADAFYAAVQGPSLSADRRAIHRQASAGLLWGLQFYNYDVDVWLRGDAHPPPQSRLRGRNWDWRHLSVADVISMPDKWEYPWFAAWDLAFHTLAMASVDIDQAKNQLKLMVKEWYQHPNGQIPAYEWELSDLNPPVHAWAAYQIYKIERKQKGKGDRVFLERVFHKLLINFAWWVNKRDVEGNNVFEGGFLGLDNISVFDRSEPMPPGFRLEQADATAWMAMYCLDLMRIALELSLENSAYEDLASKFLEHFLRIAHALHHAENGVPLWDDEEGFYYDILVANGQPRHVRVRSMVGLIPLFAVHVITPEVYRRLDNFRRRTEWFLDRYPHLSQGMVGRLDGRHVLCAVTPERIERVLAHLFDEGQFLSAFGPRSLSKEHAREPAVLWQGQRRLEVGYEPGESTTRMKGGNSNWRGPVWFPTGYMLYRSLLRLEHGFGDALRIPGTAGRPARTLREGADELANRMISIFERGADGRRPVFGDSRLFQTNPHFKDKLLFYEYFHGETGEGLGASHQTGWTALVAEMVLRLARRARGQE